MARTVMVTITKWADEAESHSYHNYNWSFSTENSECYETGGTGINLKTKDPIVNYKLTDASQNNYYFSGYILNKYPPDNRPTITIIDGKIVSLNFPQGAATGITGITLSATVKGTNPPVTTNSPDPEVDGNDV